MAGYFHYFSRAIRTAAIDLNHERLAMRASKAIFEAAVCNLRELAWAVEHGEASPTAWLDRELAGISEAALAKALSKKWLIGWSRSDGMTPAMAVALMPSAAWARRLAPLIPLQHWAIAVRPASLLPRIVMDLRLPVGVEGVGPWNPCVDAMAALCASGDRSLRESDESWVERFNAIAQIVKDLKFESSAMLLAAGALSGGSIQEQACGAWAMKRDLQASTPPASEAILASPKRRAAL